MNKLYIVRHGQTDWNKEHRCQGGAVRHIPLNERGREQARGAGEELSGVRFDVVMCSPLVRARQTCNIILTANKFNGAVMYDEDLKERDYSKFDGKVIPEGTTKPTWDLDRDGEFENIETIASMNKRIHGLLEELKSKYDNKNILLVCHGGVSRIIYYYFNPIPANRSLFEYQSENCRVEKYDL
jgi:broad specificity phosphatase PhoE